MLDLENISFKNKKAWYLIQHGLTCGCFQLESNLGQFWCQKIKPENINELSAVISLIRPACLESKQTERYAAIKQGELTKATYGDKDIDKILEPTLGILMFQEQLMKFGNDIAWKHLPEIERLVKVDKLRKGIGKKDSKLIQELKSDFINGCVHNGKERELAENLFEVIEGAGRYAFNDAHAKKYAHYSYKTAYLKANYTLEFYVTYLDYSKYKIKPKDELKNLINEARILKINILPPNITEQNKGFKIINRLKNTIVFGLEHIKNVGKQDIVVIQTFPINNWTDLFYHHFKEEKPRFRSLGMEALICSGACDCFGIERNVLLQIFKLLKQLTKKRELPYVIKRLPSLGSVFELKPLLEDCVKNVCVGQRRRDIVTSEAQLLDLERKDTFRWKANKEREHLGLPLTCSAVDDKNIVINNECGELSRMLENDGMRITVTAVLDDSKNLITKRGQTPGQQMAILSVSDKTGSLRIACFPREYMRYKDNLHQNMVYTLELEGTGNGWCLKTLSVL